VARRRVQYILVCEDQQQETFVRRFLKETGLVDNWRKFRVERSFAGRGSAEQSVRQKYVTELEVGRRSHVDCTLILVIDGDRYGVEGRLRQLDRACKEKGVGVRSSEDKIAIFIPTWNIETWLAYLDDEFVNESKKNYPKLSKPSDCREHVKNLAEMCNRARLREPAPDSLKAACSEYNNRLR